MLYMRPRQLVIKYNIRLCYGSVICTDVHHVQVMLNFSSEGALLKSQTGDEPVLQHARLSHE